MNPFDDLALEIERLQATITDPKQETVVMALSFTACEKISTEICDSVTSYYDVNLTDGIIRFFAFTNGSVLMSRFNSLIKPNQEYLTRYNFKLPVQKCKVNYDWNIVAYLGRNSNQIWDKFSQHIPVILHTRLQGTKVQIYKTLAPMS